MSNTKNTEPKQRARLPFEMSVNGSNFVSLTALMRKHGFDQARVGPLGPLQFLQAIGVPIGLTIPLARGETYYIPRVHAAYTEERLKSAAEIRDEKAKAEQAAKANKVDGNSDQIAQMFHVLQRQIRQQNEMLARQNAMLETVLAELGVKERGAKSELRAVG